MGRPRGRKRSRAPADTGDDDTAGKVEPALFPIGADVEVRSDDQGQASASPPDGAPPMRRPRGRKRSRARADLGDNVDAAGKVEPALFPIGTEVEVRSDDPGFDGSFYEATIEGYLPSGGRGYVVAYAMLIRGEDGSSPHREYVAAVDVRPRPPLQRRECFAVHEMVEAFYNEGWWAGVICRVPPPAPDGERPQRMYTVCFPATREVLEFDESRLRPRLVFLGERWVTAVEAENRRPMFREGSHVEVSRSLKTFGEYWSPATVQEVIDATSFVVQYGDVREDGEVVTEIMDAQYIRPGRNIFHNMDSKYRFSPSSFVEVFHEGSWWPGVILEVLDDKFMKKYVVKIMCYETDMEDDVEIADVLRVGHSKLRPRYDWNGKKWVRCLTEKQFNNGPQSKYAVKDQSSNDIDKIAALTSRTDIDEIRGDSGSSSKEKLNNSDAMLAAVCPDLSMCKENVQTKQKLNPCPETTARQLNSVLDVASPQAFPSQLSVSGFGHLKYDPKHFLSNQLQLSSPQMISMLSVPQTEQFQASLFGAFGQLRSLPQGPVLGTQSLVSDFASIDGSKNAFSVREKQKQSSDKGYCRMADPQQETNAVSFVGTALCRKIRKGRISYQTPEEPGENHETVLTKKRIDDKTPEETSQDEFNASSMKEMKSNYDKDLLDGATHRSGIPSEIDKVATIDSTPLKDNKGSQEESLCLSQSSAVDEIILNGIPVRKNELHQGIRPLRFGATKVSILSQNAMDSVTTLDKSCEVNVLLSDSLTHQHRTREAEAENSDISMEKEAVEELCQQVLFVANDASAELLPSAELCEVPSNDHQQQKDNIADMVQLNTSSVVPTDSVSTTTLAIFSDIVPNLFPLSMGVSECHENRMQLPSIMPETQLVSADGPFSAASLPAVNSDIITKQSVADDTAFSALTQLSSDYGSNSTESEHGDRLIEPKGAEGTPMSKYIPSRTQDSSCHLQRSLNVHKNILADSHSESLGAKNLPFVKTSPIWPQIEAMEMFRKMPQQPNFHQFQHHVPELREGMALGLMFSFANLGESIKQLNIKDDNSLFEEKMKALSALEAHGFDVKPLRSHLEALLHMKNDCAKLHDAMKKLEEKISHEETVDQQLGAQIGMLNSTIRQLDLQAYLLRCITQSIVSQKVNCAVEISRLKAEGSVLKHFYLSAEELFVNAA